MLIIKPVCEHVTVVVNKKLKIYVKIIIIILLLLFFFIIIFLFIFLFDDPVNLDCAMCTY